MRKHRPISFCGPLHSLLSVADCLANPSSSYWVHMQAIFDHRRHLDDASSPWPSTSSPFFLLRPQASPYGVPYALSLLCVWIVLFSFPSTHGMQCWPWLSCSLSPSFTPHRFSSCCGFRFSSDTFLSIILLDSALAILWRHVDTSPTYALFQVVRAPSSLAPLASSEPPLLVSALPTRTYDELCLNSPCPDRPILALIFHTNPSSPRELALFWVSPDAPWCAPTCHDSTGSSSLQLHSLCVTQGLLYPLRPLRSVRHLRSASLPIPNRCLLRLPYIVFWGVFRCSNFPFLAHLNPFHPHQSLTHLHILPQNPQCLLISFSLPDLPRTNCAFWALFLTQYWWLLSCLHQLALVELWHALLYQLGTLFWQVIGFGGRLRIVPS